MSRRRIPFFPCLVAALATIGGGTERDVHAQAKIAQLTPAGDHTYFAIKLFQRQFVAGKNILVSPLSLYLALAMTINGTSGKTFKEMAALLGLKDSEQGLETFNKYNRNLLANVDGLANSRVSINNAVFVDNGTPVRPEFITLCHDFYNATVQNLNFGNQVTVAKINEWCKQKTAGKIPNIISDLGRNDLMVLLDTVYFKAFWEQKFDSNRTHPRPFHLSATDTASIKSVLMMQKEFKTGYAKTPEFEALRLYYEYRKQSCYVFLPMANGIPCDPDRWQATLTDAKWRQWSQSFKDQQVDVTIPKIKFESECNLNKTLSDMGMVSAFKPDADLRRMLDKSPGFIGRILQKTYITVDESGTEAAAATFVVPSRGLMSENAEIAYFVADRPFVFALVDESTREILFMGSIYNPAPD